MKKTLLIIILLLGAFTLIICEDIVPFYDTEGIAIINKMDYVPNMIKLFDSAENSIQAMIYQVRYYEKYPDGVNRQMYESLIRAAERNVKVQIIVDQSSWNVSSTLKNEQFAEYMKANGIEVYFDPADKTTHTKVVIVDSLYTVIGSTNWSFYAFEKNNESAVIVKSEKLALDYVDYFHRLLEFSTVELTIPR